jgi:hypothetical protein
MGQHIQTIAYALLALGQLFVFGKYVCQGLIHWRDRNKAETKFLRELKENHLKHIYETLRAICFYLNIPYEEPR